MPHFVIKVISSKKNAYCVDSPGPFKNDLHAWDFRMGKDILQPVGALSVKTDKDHGAVFLDAIPTQGLEFIISGRLKNLFEELKLVNLKNFPVTVTDCFKKKKYDYWLCNIIGLIPCLDLQNADVVRDKTGDEIFILKKLALDESAIQEYNSKLEPGK